jgi:5-methylcytosine-specific restriction endonuclease McrA
LRIATHARHIFGMTKDEEIELAYGFRTSKVGTPQYYRDIRYEEQDAKCHYCDVVMTQDKKYADEDHYCTADHSIPKCRNGSDEYENIVACCRLCNFLKDSMTESEYLASMAFFVYRQSLL